MKELIEQQLILKMTGKASYPFDVMTYDQIEGLYAHAKGPSLPADCIAIDRRSAPQWLRYINESRRIDAIKEIRSYFSSGQIDAHGQPLKVTLLDSKNFVEDVSNALLTTRL